MKHGSPLAVPTLNDRDQRSGSRSESSSTNEAAPLRVFERTIQIALEDVRFGHVNFSNYLNYICDTIQAWYTALGFGPNAGEPDGPFMAHLSCDFLGEMSYPGAVSCVLTVVRVGSSSLEHDIELRDTEQPTSLYARAKSRNVWVDRSLGRPAPWPPDVLALCWRGD